MDLTSPTPSGCCATAWAMCRHVLFALGYGGNGSIYRAIAAGVLATTVAGRTHRYRETFRFER